MGEAIQAAESGVVILTQYKTKVHASNRNSDYGVPVTVFAENRRDAFDKAVAVGWSGERRDARVTVLKIEQVPIVVPATRPGAPS